MQWDFLFLVNIVLVILSFWFNRARMILGILLLSGGMMLAGNGYFTVQDIERNVASYSLSRLAMEQQNARNMVLYGLGSVGGGIVFTAWGIAGMFQRPKTAKS